MLTSTSAAPGSLLKHMVMVFRAILKKLVKDTDFPCNKETLNIMSHGVLKESEGDKKETPSFHIFMVFGHYKTTTGNVNKTWAKKMRSPLSHHMFVQKVKKSEGRKKKKKIKRGVCAQTNVSTVHVYVCVSIRLHLCASPISPRYISPGLDPLSHGHSCYREALKVTINLPAPGLEMYGPCWKMTLRILYPHGDSLSFSFLFFFLLRCPDVFKTWLTLLYFLLLQ